MLSVARKIFGTANDRKLKPLRARVNRINALEPIMEALSDQSLRGKTQEFRKRLADGATLDSLLEEAFAVVREAAKRVNKATRDNWKLQRAAKDGPPEGGSPESVALRLAPDRDVGTQHRLHA